MSCDLVTLSQALVLLAQLFGILSDNILNFGLIDNMFLSDNMLHLRISDNMPLECHNFKTWVFLP